jgi:hypothetical protein
LESRDSINNHQIGGNHQTICCNEISNLFSSSTRPVSQNCSMQQSESFKATATTFRDMGPAEKARAIVWQNLNYKL